MSITSGLIWSYIERWGNKAISLAVFVVLARLLEPRDFGLVAFAKLFIDYLDSFSGQGLSFAIIQRKNVTDQHLNTAFWINLLTSLGLVLLLLILAPAIERLFSEQGVTDILRVLSIMVIINALSRVQVAILTREQRFKQLSIRGLAMSLAGGLTGVTMAIGGYGVWSLVCQQIIAVCVALIILWGTTTWRPKLTFSFVSAKEMYSYASRIVVDQQVVFLSQRLDEALIAIFLGTTLLGYYSTAKRLFETAADMFYGVLSKVLLSTFSILQDKLSAISGKMESVVAFYAAFVFPIFIAGAVANKEVIELIFGEKWAFGATPFAILMISGLFLLTPNILHPVFHSLGKAGIPLKLNTYRAVFSIVFLSIGATFGIIGIAIGILMRNFVGAAFDLISYKGLVGARISSFYSIQFRYIFYCIPMALAIWGVSYRWHESMNTYALFAIIFISGASVYLITLLAFRAHILELIVNKIRYWLRS